MVDTYRDGLLQTPLSSTRLKMYLGLETAQPFSHGLEYGKISPEIEDQ